MIKIRLVHFYLGVFFAPMIIFFAFSGTLQVFKLHEAYRETPGARADWIAWMGEVHKEQDLVEPRAAPPKAKPAAAPRQPKAPSPMKWLTALMGIALMATTLLGLYIAFGYPSRRRGFGVALVLGALLPIVLLSI